MTKTFLIFNSILNHLILKFSYSDYEYVFFLIYSELESKFKINILPLCIKKFLWKQPNTNNMNMQDEE